MNQISNSAGRQRNSGETSGRNTGRESVHGLQGCCSGRNPRVTASIGRERQRPITDLGAPSHGLEVAGGAEGAEQVCRGRASAGSDAEGVPKQRGRGGAEKALTHEWGATWPLERLQGRRPRGALRALRTLAMALPVAL